VGGAEARLSNCSGRSEETQSQFDLRMLELLVRGFTRDLIEAEQSFAEVREALATAGIQVPGSDVESGFVDHQDDGYRLSREQEKIQMCDTAAIRRWLERLTGDSTWADRSDVDIDKWDCSSVGFCDSMSMKAVGRWRRKIDEWQKLAEDVRCRLAKGAF
jgi:sugar phosphate isomerase/epimerase